jgi:hypothetical protein
MEVQFRAPKELIARFDSLAGGHGTRAARLRRLVVRACGVAGLAPMLPKQSHRRANVGLRLTAGQVARLDKEAAWMGMSRASWVTALVRRRTNNIPTVSRPDQRSLSAVLAELRRITADINQIARTLEASGPERDGPNPAVQYLDQLRLDVREQMASLRGALKGNLAYWQIEM